MVADLFTKHASNKHKLPNGYTLWYTHIYTFSEQTHGEDHPGGSSLFENNENSAAAWCSTAGRGSAESTQERLASHLAAVVAECGQTSIMINSPGFSNWKTKPSAKRLRLLFLDASGQKQ